MLDGSSLLVDMVASSVVEVVAPRSSDEQASLVAVLVSSLVDSELTLMVGDGWVVRVAPSVVLI